MMFTTLFKIPRGYKKFAEPIQLPPLNDLRPAEEELKKYDEYMLLEDMTFILHKDGSSTEYSRLITMPMSDQELAGWNEVTLFDAAPQTKTRVLTAKTLLPDGKVRKARRRQDSFTDTSTGKRLQVIRKVLCFEPLRPGVIVEFELAKDYWEPSDFGAALFRHHFFRSAIPCLRRRLTIAIHQQHTGRFEKYHDAPDPVELTVGAYHVLQWDEGESAGIELCGDLPSGYDILPRIEFTTLDDWQVVTKFHRDNLYTANMEDGVEQVAQDIFKPEMSKREKVLAAYAFCTQEIRYGRHPDETNVRQTRKIPGILEELRGDCKDKSYLLKIILEQAGIQSDIVIVMTTDMGSEVPMPPGRFNHAILRTEIDGEEIWMDPAAAYFTFGQMPETNWGAVAIDLSKPDDAGLTRVPAPLPKHEGSTNLVKAAIHDDGNMTMSREVTLRGDRAAYFRAGLDQKKGKSPRDVLVDAFSTTRFKRTIADVTTNDVFDLSEDLTYTYHTEWDQIGKIIRDLMHFEYDLGHPIYNNDVSLPQAREVPISSAGVQSHRTAGYLKFPPGYRLVESPEDYVIDEDYCTTAMQYTVHEDRLEFELTCQTRDLIIPAEDYDAFCAHVRNNINQAVIKLLFERVAD